MKVDLLIAGIGSAGFAAAYRFMTARPDASVALVDTNPGPGGTSVFGGVCCWEPGRSGHGVHYELARRLLASGEGFVGKTTEFYNPEICWAISSKCGDPYESTLKRHGVMPEDMRRFHFEPDAMSRVMTELLSEARVGRRDIFFDSRVISAEKTGRSVSSVRVITPEGEKTIEPGFVIDCTGGAVLARLAGEPTSMGEESREAYGEPSAPTFPSMRLNGITQCFRVAVDERPLKRPDIPEEYGDIDLSDWESYMRQINGPVACWNMSPNGGYVVNMLPTASGEMLAGAEIPELKRICEARVYCYWRRLWDLYPFVRKFRIDCLFPQLGLRENRRTVGRYVLREQDLVNGIPSCGADRVIAIADHPADIHGSGGRLTPTGVYGIPFDCLIPLNTDNLLVAGMSASFSHIAASSARLSRTMLELGEAAGLAAAMCIERKEKPSEIDITDLRYAVKADLLLEEIANAK